MPDEAPECGAVGQQDGEVEEPEVRRGVGAPRALPLDEFDEHPIVVVRAESGIGGRVVEDAQSQHVAVVGD